MMTKSGLVLLLLPAIILQGSYEGILAQKEARIVGGSYVDEPGTYPWFTMLVYKDSDNQIQRQYCGGTLISDQWVLTAAHCIDDHMRYNGGVRVGAFQPSYTEGDNGGQDVEYFDLQSVVKHPDYDSSMDDNDFALLRLNGTASITPLSVDNTGLSFSFNTGYSHLWAIGHGNTAHFGDLSDNLKHVNLKYVSNTECYRDYHYDQSDITSNMMCARDDGEDSCQGDSGGPLYDSANDVLVGVVSFGIGCANKNYPGVYARVSAQFDWIKETVCSNSRNPPEWCGDYPHTCSDSSLLFKVMLGRKIRYKGCDWVRRNPDKRCRKAEFSKVCPISCGTCLSCANTKRRFKVGLQSGKVLKRRCDWANARRCEHINGLADACRESCGKCTEKN